MLSFSHTVLRQFRIETSKFHRLAYTCGNCVLFLVNGVDKTTKPTNTKITATTEGKSKTPAINLERLSFDFKQKTKNALLNIDGIRFLSTTASNFSKTTKDSESIENMENKSEKINVNKEELKKRLTPLQYQVTQEAATERPFTGCYNKHYEKGVYQCIVCHQDLFSSDTKYDSGCGWPAFNDVVDKGKVTLHRDASIPDRIRTEVRCSKCSAHMGHVFEDGPKPTRKRYCINSASIEFVSAEELNKRAAAPPIASTNSVQSGAPIAQQ